MSNTTTTPTSFWNSELMRTYQLAESRGLTLKAAISMRAVREQGGLFAVHDDPVNFAPWAPLMASDSLEEVRAFLRCG